MATLPELGNSPIEANRTSMASEESLLHLVERKLAARLPDGWSIGAVTTADGPSLELKLPNQQVSFLVEVLDDLRPRDVRARFGSGLTRRLRAAATWRPLLVAAPELSAPTRAALRKEEISYIDGRGNAWLTAPGVPLLVDVEVPAGPVLTSSGTRRGLAGSAAGRVMRVLVDGRPPATLDVVARAAGVSVGYCSRVVRLLADELLVERTARGGVADADWPALLRRRGELVTLFRRDVTESYVARDGVAAVLEQLRAAPPDGLWCVTGSYAAARYAPVTAPTGLTLWALDPAVLTAQLRLLPTEQGGDLRIVKAPDAGPFNRLDGDDGAWWERPTGAALEGLRWAAPTQVVIDCLGGTGRMPDEGEALLEWLRSEERNWRTRSIADLPVTETAR